MSYFFIINPRAGKKHGDVKALIAEAAANKNIKWTAEFTKASGHAKELAAEAVKQGYKNIIAVGGDGTIQETASGLLGADVNFGLLPCGSGNGLARNLNIPLNVKAAAEGLFYWQPKLVDIGFSNNKLFLVSCGIGLDADVAHCFNSQSHGRGILPYVWHALRIYFSYKTKNVNAKIDGQDKVLNGLIITALIGRQYGGGAIIAPKAIVDDGFLDLCTVKPVCTLKLLRYLPHLFSGTLYKFPSVYSDILCKDILFDYAKPFWYHLDGEDFYCETGKLSVSISSKALKIIRP